MLTLLWLGSEWKHSCRNLLWTDKLEDTTSFDQRSIVRMTFSKHVMVTLLSIKGIGANVDEAYEQLTFDQMM